LNVTIDELDLEAEQNVGRRPPTGNQEPPEEQSTGSFGLTLDNLSPQVARRLRIPSGQSGALITDVDADGPAAGALRQGDVILSVNGKAVSNAADAARELGKVVSGHLAQMRVWRGESEVFVPVKKE
jgi:S1-C subfamily serine protease